MRMSAIAHAAIALAFIASPLLAADIKVVFENTGQGGTLPERNASCVASHGKAAAGSNKSPGISWSKGPAGTRSYALAMTDPDVPRDLSLLNKDGTMIARDLPRMEFTHWILANIPATITRLAEGADGDGLPQGGLPLETTEHGRRGQNGFAAFLKDGPYGGYMGACPPWNDLRIHRYRVTVYALDTERLSLPDAFTRTDFLAAAKRHVLASGAAELTYTINARATK
ncbi:YbhB/YbcL family Raf kinase inhibitor-like protein [Rhizobium mesoamericanum]|uniref:YbhB/YbcL family Raf kinase inhibitor-like protein n=1 Tax=Rhizobium mesoamericanum TaxID=1079800 RepID=UPI00041B5B82|nr:YbhB/YbcL family Raf kinase inhibitor-like protein [Rhizobium mesoamericanum]